MAKEIFLDKVKKQISSIRSEENRLNFVQSLSIEEVLLVKNSTVNQLSFILSIIEADKSTIELMIEMLKKYTKEVPFNYFLSDGEEEEVDKTIDALTKLKNNLKSNGKRQSKKLKESLNNAVNQYLQMTFDDDITLIQ